MNIGYMDIITQMVHKKDNNHYIHATDTDLGYSTFFNDNSHEDPEAPSQFELKEEADFELMVEDGPMDVF